MTKKAQNSHNVEMKVCGLDIINLAAKQKTDGMLARDI